MFSSVPMLAYGIQIYTGSITRIIIYSIIALYSGFFAALIWNDITDAEIDAIVHPNRLLPSGKISKKTFFIIAVVFSASTFIFSYLISFWCLALVGAAALFVTFHDKYLKKIIKLPAYSEIFTPIQWIIVPLFGYIAIAGSNYVDMLILIVFTYLADGAHDLPEGIHDIDGDLVGGVKTYATSFGEKKTSMISFSMLLISGFLGMLLFYRTILGFVFLIPFLIIWFYALYHSYKLMSSDVFEMKKIGKTVGEKLFRYFWLTYDLIFLDVFLQLVMHNFRVI